MLNGWVCLSTARQLIAWQSIRGDRESSSRETKRFESRMRTAKLRHVGASPEDVDYKSRRGLDKALFQQMLTGRWIKDRRNLMIHCLTGEALHRREELVHAALAKPGWPALWHKQPAETASPCCTSVCRVSLTSWN